jgi:hypothetical protein
MYSKCPNLKKCLEAAASGPAPPEFKVEPAHAGGGVDCVPTLKDIEIRRNLRSPC